jgi:UDP-glucuronate 4-epimerase
MTHVMITGCAGFIGYHLAQSLQDDGHKVSGFDNFNHYYDVSLKNARANNLRERSIEVSYVDLLNL